MATKLSTEYFHVHEIQGMKVYSGISINLVNHTSQI